MCNHFSKQYWKRRYAWPGFGFLQIFLRSATMAKRGANVWAASSKTFLIWTSLVSSLRNHILYYFIGSILPYQSRRFQNQFKKIFFVSND